MCTKSQFLEYLKTASSQHLYYMERENHPGVSVEHALARRAVFHTSLSTNQSVDTPIVKAVVEKYRFDRGEADTSLFTLLIAIERAWEYYQERHK
jgi:hypothetical protein